MYRALKIFQAPCGHFISIVPSHCHKGAGTAPQTRWAGEHTEAWRETGPVPAWDASWVSAIWCPGLFIPSGSGSPAQRGRGGSVEQWEVSCGLSPQEQRPQPSLGSWRHLLGLRGGHMWPVAIGLGTSPTLMSGIIWSSAPLLLLPHFTDEEPAAQSSKMIYPRSQHSTPGLQNLKPLALSQTRPKPWGRCEQAGPAAPSGPPRTVRGTQALAVLRAPSQVLCAHTNPNDSLRGKCYHHFFIEI